MTLYNDLLSAGLPVIFANDDSRQATFSRPLTDAEDQIYFSAAHSDIIAKQNDANIATAQIRAEYQNTLATLQQIEDTQSPTNVQVIAAVKFLARTLRLLLKLLARMI